MCRVEDCAPFPRPPFAEIFPPAFGRVLGFPPSRLSPQSLLAALHFQTSWHGTHLSVSLDVSFFFFGKRLVTKTGNKCPAQYCPLGLSFFSSANFSLFFCLLGPSRSLPVVVDARSLSVSSLSDLSPFKAAECPL